jgi:hypothetical protein
VVGDHPAALHRVAEHRPAVDDPARVVVRGPDPPAAGPQDDGPAVPVAGGRLGVGDEGHLLAGGPVEHVDGPGVREVLDVDERGPDDDVLGVDGDGPAEPVVGDGLGVRVGAQEVAGVRGDAVVEGQEAELRPGAGRG